MSANRLRWDGRPGWYEVWYVTVAGLFWLRYTLLVPTDPEREGEAALWLASFTGQPAVRKTIFPLEAFSVGAGGFPLELGPGRLTDTEATGPGWELRLEGPERPFLHAPPLVRALRLSRTQVAVTKPALRISGAVDGHELDAVPGGQAHVWGTRHAQRWGWAHAALPGDRWLEAVTARLPRLPELSFVAVDGRRSGLVRTRARLEPGRWRVGPYRLEADRDDFVGVTYHDPDGSPAFCYHTERARLLGPGVEAEGVALEYGARSPLEGWPLSS